MKEFWNQRYSQAESAYGEGPNLYLKANLAKIPAGKILLPAEGEGRNALYAAQKGWQVSAFDMSQAGKLKADQLAENNGLKIDYQVGEFSEVKYPKESFDCIGLVYAHFPAALKTEYHRILDTYLRPGGIVIFEAFSKSHLKYNSVNPAAGGPKREEILFSIEELRHDFPGYKILELKEEEIELSEGLYHNGKCSVIRFIGKKRGFDLPVGFRENN